MKNVTPYHLSLFFISSALLALEISLMRVLRIEGFGNFTFTAIALALTGFGGGGTLVFLLKTRLNGKERTVSMFSAVLFIFFLGIGYYISKEISFDPLRIVWDKNQLIRLFIRYFIYTVPFIAGSTFIVLAFTVEKAGRAYFFNLTGSGFGIFAILVSFYLIPSNRIFIVPMLFASFSFILLYFSLNPNYKLTIIVVILIFSGYTSLFKGSINILPYKGIKLALNLPDAKMIHRKISPFGTLEVVKSSKIRTAPGLSLSFDGSIPDQLGLFLDGDTLSAIDRADGKKSVHYLHFQTQSAAYLLYNCPSVFLIGLGGGVAAERAFLNSARSIVIAEENPQLGHLLKDTFKDYNNNFFNENNIDIIKNNGRCYLNQSDARWDIIEISETDSLVSSIGGIYATDTNYNLTTQAFQDYLTHIHEKGTISVTVLLKYPPRSLLKLVNLAKHALDKNGIDPLKNIIVIRSWSTGTVLIKKLPFTDEEIGKIKTFCERMLFDLVYYPGISKEETNRYNIVKDAYYYKSIMQIFKNPDIFTKNYLFNVKHTTDGRPYFSYFFKLNKLPRLFKEMGRKWILVVEGGYLILFSTFIISIILSFILIIVPLLFSGKRIKRKKVEIIFYFSSIAISYMFIEIVLIKKFTRFLANPVYSSSIIIAALLIFSGIGSFFSDYFEAYRKKAVSYAIIFIAGYVLLILLAGDTLYISLFKASLLLKLIISLFIICPLGFAMGIPFPSAIGELRKRKDYSIPWAWSINGYLSVIASTGAVIIASNIGLLLTGMIALFCYLGALLFFPK